MQAWEQFLLQQEAELGSQTVRKWLRSLKMQRFDACNLYLEAKDTFQVLWFEEHIRAKAQAHLFNGNHKKIKIHLSVANSVSDLKKNKKQAGVNKDAKTAPFKLQFDTLDPHCLFEHYVAGQDNGMALQVLHELAGLLPAKESYNPIYLYGPSGCGKTHLLMSLAHCFQARGQNCLYVRGELFTDHVVTAIRAGEMSTFRQAYRKADILLVDDVHVFSRRGATQEEFFHTFNSLHLEGKQIVLSAHCSPQELQLIEPRLVSRFEWGITLPLKPLSTQELKTILQAKANALKFSLPSKISDFLVETFNTNPKYLIKAFEALILRLHLDSHHSIHGLSAIGAKTLLADLIAEQQKIAITPPKILQAVAEYFGIRIEDILGKSQARDSVLPRQIAMHFYRTKLKMPFMKIGDLFARDHSTVMTSIKHIQKSIDADVQEIVDALQIIDKKLQNR